MVKIALLLLPLISAVLCLNIKIPEAKSSQSTLLRSVTGSILDSFKYPVRDLNESLILPNALKVHRYDNTSEVFRVAQFYSNMCKTSNCRASFDKWDCDNCNSTLPDGVVLRQFQTFPLGVTGEIVISEKRRSIYVIFRGASSLRAKLLFFKSDLINHPMIPGARVQTGLLESLLDIRDIVYRTVIDQLTIHPAYKVHVVGHSFGSALGSLATVDLFQRLSLVNAKEVTGHLFGKPRVGDIKYAKYVGDNDINITRYVERDDDIVHHPYLEDDFRHEGDEYWVKSNDPFEILVCPGPTETRNCSSSLKTASSGSHLNYLGVIQSCESDIFNLF